MRALIDLLHNRMVQIIAIGAACALILMSLNVTPRPLVLSRWGGFSGAARALGIDPPRQAPAESAGIVASARPNSIPRTPGSNELEAFNQASHMIESAASGSIRMFTRTLGSGTISYMVVLLDTHSHLEVLTADGATLGSDASGDTIWVDGGRHLRTVAEMSKAPAAQRPGMTLLGVMAFGFHGAERAADEGTIVINGKLVRINAGRGVLCIHADQTVEVGLFDARTITTCQQAAGAGPIVMVGGKIAHTGVSAETAEFVPFNPYGEDFVQIDWRKQIYTGDYPKTMIGVGRHTDGRHYLVLLNSTGIDGIEAVRQLKAMGCSEAIGGDDDTSTQIAWRGNQIGSRKVRAVPTAIGIFAVDSTR